MYAPDGTNVSMVQDVGSLGKLCCCKGLKVVKSCFTLARSIFQFTHNNNCKIHFNETGRQSKRK